MNYNEQYTGEEEGNDKSFMPRSDNRKGYYFVLTKALDELREALLINDPHILMSTTKSAYLISIPFLSKKDIKEIEKEFNLISSSFLLLGCTRNKGFIRGRLVYKLHYLVGLIMNGIKPLLLQQQQELFDDEEGFDSLGV